MAPDLFDQLAKVPVPPPPVKFTAGLHERINQRLLLGHLIDFAVRGVPFVLLNLYQALLGLVRLTVTGRFESDHSRDAK